MTIPLYEPKVSVLLYKNIGRTEIADGVPVSSRYAGSKRVINLTPFIGENGSVVVHKSVRHIEGMFSITLSDVSIRGETVYARIEPMDVIEIRMARNLSLYPGNTPPIMMRGFVSQVQREESMVNGKPSRHVVISGADYGKILSILQIAYLPGVRQGAALVSSFRMAEAYNLNLEVHQPASEFVTDVMSSVVNPFIGQMAEDVGDAGQTSPVTGILVDASVPDTNVVSAFGTNQWPGGTAYSLLAYYGDVGPWNELFIEDREDAPYLVYRPNPFLDAAGNWISEPYISDPSKCPAVNFISDLDIVSMSVMRSDANVANYYWVESPHFALLAGNNTQLELINNSRKEDYFLDSSYGNCSTDFYGLRTMQVQTQQGLRIDGRRAGALASGAQTLDDFIREKRKTLIATNRDIVVFESGTLKLKGDESIRPGHVLSIRRGSLTSQAYAVEVTHEFAPYRSYTTTVKFERGTGFIERAKRPDVTAPYYAEVSAVGAAGAV